MSSVRHTEFLHYLLISHLASLILLSVSCPGGVSLWSRNWVDHRPCIYLMEMKHLNNDPSVLLAFNNWTFI